MKTHQETLKCHHVAEMIIVRYGRRPRHAKLALNAAAEDCSLDVRVPEMIAESLLFGRLSACLHTANTAPVLINEPCSQQRLATEDRRPDCLAKGMQPPAPQVASIDLHVCLFGGMWFLGEACSPSCRTLPWPLRSVRRQLAFAPETPCLGIDRSRMQRERLGQNV